MAVHRPNGVRFSISVNIFGNKRKIIFQMASEASGNSTGIGERRSVSPPPIRSFKGARLRRGVDAARRHAGGCDRLSIAIPPRWSLVPGWQSVAARPTNGKRRRRYHHGCSPICGVGFGEAQSLRTLWNGRARRSNRSRPVSLVKPEKEAAKRQRRGVCPARFAAHSAPACRSSPAFQT